MKKKTTMKKTDLETKMTKKKKTKKKVTDLETKASWVVDPGSSSPGTSTTALTKVKAKKVKEIAKE